MTAREFHDAWRRAQVLEFAGGIWLIVCMCMPLLIFTDWEPDPVRGFIDSARRWAKDEGTYGSIVGLLGFAILLPFVVIGLAPTLWLNRRFGVRCSHCSYKLAGRSGRHEIFRTGRCFKCGGFLCEPDAELAAATAPASPAKIVWVYAAISGLLLLVALAARSHVVGERQVLLPLMLSLMASLTGVGVGLCDSIRYQTREVWRATAMALVAAGCTATLLWLAATGQGYFAP